MNTKELWLPIPGFRFYEVSNIGRIRSIDHISSKMSRWGIAIDFFIKGKILKENKVKNSGGYYSKILCENGKKTTVMVHRVVALAFCEGFKPGLVVNHKNGIRTDNRASNLEWVTYSQNVIYSRIKFRTKGKSLGIDKALEIIKKAGTGSRVTDLAKEYSVTRQCVSRILSGRLWPSKSYPEIGLFRKKYKYISPKHGTRFLIG